MTDSNTPSQRRAIPFIPLFVIAAVVWTTAAAIVLIGELDDRESFLLSNALSSARATYEKDVAFRRWAARHGGVYVPVTPETPPNPYLDVPERDIATPSGRHLTLINPAYMNRQLYEISREHSGAPQGHITSLKPIRPENAPDNWEKKALGIIEKGKQEFSEFQMENGKQLFRFMSALKTEKHCLKCHAVQGYHEGDIRGGISVSIRVDDLAETINRSSARHSGIIILLWLLGLGGLWLALRRIERDARELSESEERYRQQFQQSGAVMLIVDPENGAIIDANPAACSFYGYPSEFLLTLKIADINTSPPDDLARCIIAVRDGMKRQFTACHRLADGTTCDVEVFSNPVVFKGKTLLHSIVIDITGRLVAEQELRDKMDFAENLILNSTTPTFVVNSDHQVLIWNRALEELTGVKSREVAGSSQQWCAFYPAARPCLADFVLNGEFEQAEALYPRLSHSRLIPDGLHAEGDFIFDSRRCRLVFSAAPICDRDGRIIAAIETLEDITERISLEAQLFQSQKMESVGVLAGGIAHDFNNVLTVINGYADLLKMTLPDDDENQHIAREINASVNRAADMTRSLLAFSGKHELQMQYNDLNRILAEIRKSLGRLIREDITLTITLCDEQLPIFVDRVQIEQVLINLVVNARDAIGPGGTITISTMPVQRRTTEVEGTTVILPGNYACLAVGDNGGGIDSETLTHIFEPFFTTKKKGKGTGLGLSIVQSIVTKHSGSISVMTAPGTGTEFRVYLPLYAGEAPNAPAGTAKSIDHHGTETVLVVEDDSDVMKLLCDVLGRYGYTIIAAADGVEAIELFNAHRGEIRIAIVDVILPRMNGREVVEQIRRQQSALPVIMTSGYTDEIINRAGIESLDVIFLQKPVRPLELLSTIRSCLQPVPR
ncbi:MAG: ATP-binding protein [Pelobacteraceae bacterium]